MDTVGGVSAEKALDRVRKLLALATSPDVHEAATAAAQAQALITRHRLERWLDAEREAADDPDPIADATDAPLEVARKLRPWKVALACALAEVNGCVAYTLDRGDTQAIALVGRSRDRAAVETLWAWAVKRVEWLSATHGEGKSRKCTRRFAWARSTCWRGGSARRRGGCERRRRGRSWRRSTGRRRRTGRRSIASWTSGWVSGRGGGCGWMRRRTREVGGPPRGWVCRSGQQSA